MHHVAPLLLLSAWCVAGASETLGPPEIKIVTRMRGGSTAREDGPYSFSLTTFSPRGSLSQIEYAIRSAQTGALSAAVVYDGGIVVGSIRKTQSPLVMESGTRKIARVTDRGCLLYSGLAADSRVLARKAVDIALEYRMKFGETAKLPVEILVSKIAMMMQEYTQIGGVRPFGTSLLMASIDVDGPRLYKLEPSGSFSAWKSVAIGEGSVAAEALLHEGYEESMDRDRALELLLIVLKKSSGARRGEVETAFLE